MKIDSKVLLRRMANSGWVFMLLVATLAARPALSQEFPFEYAVKCICGTPPTTPPILAPGRYFTAINVHNPGREGVSLLKRVAVALPSEKPGQIFKLPEGKLGKDEAFEIDCQEIQRAAHNERFVKGFVLIESPVELDVVAVYSASGATGKVETLALERVPPRKR